MATDAATIQRWLGLTTKLGVKRYARLTLCVHELSESPVMQTWPAAEVAAAVKEDMAEYAEVLWSMMQDHTAEVQRNGRFELTWYSKEGTDLGSKVVRCPYSGEELRNDSSAEGQIELAQKHAQFQATDYNVAKERAYAMMDNSVAVLERMVVRQEGQLEAMHAREMKVAERESAAAAQGPQQSSEAELIDAGARAEIIDIVGKFIGEDGGGKAVSKALVRWVDKEKKVSGGKKSNGVTKEEPTS